MTKLDHWQDAGARALPPRTHEESLGFRDRAPSVRTVYTAWNACGKYDMVYSSASAASVTLGAGSCAQLGLMSVSTSVQCTLRSRPSVGSAPRPYCGKQIGMPPLRMRVRLHGSRSAFKLGRQVPVWQLCM
jgi:hypothetical protein